MSSLLALLLAGPSSGQILLAPSEHYELAHLLQLGFELKSAEASPAGDTLYLQGRLSPKTPVIIVRCSGQTIATSSGENCRRVY